MAESCYVWLGRSLLCLIGITLLIGWYEMVATKRAFIRSVAHQLMGKIRNQTTLSEVSMDGDNSTTRRLIERLGDMPGVRMFISPTFPGGAWQKCQRPSGVFFVATYGSHGRYIRQAETACNASVAVGQADLCFALTPAFVDEEFRRKNAKVLQGARGAGYWLWKPYLQYRILTEFMSDDDVMLYLDADLKALKSLRDFACLKMEQHEDVVVFYNRFYERDWTKADAFVLMMKTADDQERVKASNQLQASVMLLSKSTRSLRLVGEWLTYAQDARIISDQKSTLARDSAGFRENRHDQTVISLTAKRWNISQLPDPRFAWDEFQRRPGAIDKPFNRLQLPRNHSLARGYPFFAVNKWKIY